MKAFRLLILTMLIADLHARGATIAQWNFNSSPSDANTATGSLLPSIGNGSAAAVGGISSSFASGDTSHDPAPSSDNTAWQTGSYPAVNSANKSAGVRFAADTSGYQSISVNWNQRNSGTASRYVRLQYSTDGANFLDADVAAIYGPSVFTNENVDLSSIPGASNNPNFAFRIVTEFESTAAPPSTNGYVATTNSSTYSGGTGTMRFDLVTVSGVPMAGANTPPLISSISNQTMRVMQTLGPLDLTVSDAEDAADSLSLSGSSSDASIIPPGGITFGGSGSNRTVSITAANQPGTCTVTIYVTDTGGKSSSTSFVVTVLPHNTPPVISAIPPTNTLVSTPVGPFPFTVGDLEAAADSLQVSGTSANQALLPSASITFGGSGSNRTVRLALAPGQAGVAPITISVSDGTNITSTVFPLLVRPSASVLFYDPFDYPNGSLLSNSAFLWDNRSGVFGQCQVTNGKLQVSAALTEDVIAPLVGGPYVRSNGTVLYASFKATFLSLPKVVPGYFAHFASGSVLRGRIYAGTTNAAANAFRLFVANGSDTNAMLAADLMTNHTYTLVTRYNIDADSTTLWLDPVSESSSGVTATDIQNASTVSAYGFRQDTDVGATILVDDLKVGLSFAAVTGAALPSPTPLSISRSGNNVVLRWSNSAFGLQRAPAAAGPFTNVPGASDPFTQPISSTPQFFRLKSN